MRFDTGTRTRLLVDMTLDFDPTGSTIEVDVDGTWYPATWLETPTAQPVSRDYPRGKWTQTAQTSEFFAGPAATPDGATVLIVGRHNTQTRLTLGGEVIVRDSTPIDVQ